MSRPQVAMSLPRPGPVLKAVLILIAASGVLEAILVHWISEPIGIGLFKALACQTHDVIFGMQLWRLLTAGLLTSFSEPNHLFFTLFGLYIFSPDLERRWGGARFARFLVSSIVFGYAFAVFVDAVGPAGLGATFHPPLMFGAAAATTATAVAWSRENADLNVNLFFLIPVSGRQFLWLTLGFCVIGLIYPTTFPEGAATPFGGFAAGLALGGTPSPLRSIYLRMRLASLQRNGSGRPARGDSGAASRRRAGGPPLRVVQGGLDDDLDKRKPPKDKRYLN